MSSDRLSFAFIFTWHKHKHDNKKENMKWIGIKIIVLYRIGQFTLF